MYTSYSLCLPNGSTLYTFLFHAFFFPHLVLYVSVFTAGTCGFALLFSHVAYCSILALTISQFSRTVVSNSLRPHEPHHTSPPCPSPTPVVYPNLCPLSRWYYPTISSSVVPFSSCPKSFPGLGSFQMSQLFASSGQSIGVSSSTSVLPINTQDWSPLGWTGWISLPSKGLSRVFSNTTVQKHNSSVLSFLYSPTLTSIHDHWKNHSLH